MKIPDLQQAEAMLREAEQLNPGPWVAHSQVVARGARALAACISEIDPQAAYILGLLHDIGRREGVYGMRHVIDGYNYLLAQGYDGAARVCLTHSFPTPQAASGSAPWDGTQEEYNFLQRYLDGIQYDWYDRLIQLCDSISLPSGYCLMEKRMVDVVLRYGFNDQTLAKWRAFIAIREEFERAIGAPIYRRLPGVVENTFGF